MFEFGKEDQRLREFIGLRLRTSELNSLKQEANREGLDLSGLIRKKLMRG